MGLEEKKSKSAYKKRKNENFEKQKMRVFLISQGSLNPKNRFLGQKVCPAARSHKERQTHRHTDRVTTEGTLSGFQDFILQPIIKDRPKNCVRLYTCIHVVIRIDWKII